MELVSASLGEDLLGGLGEHLCEAREHLLRGLGQRTLGVAEDRLSATRDRGTTGDDSSSAPERPSRVSTRALHLGGGKRADRSK